MFVQADTVYDPAFFCCLKIMKTQASGRPTTGDHYQWLDFLRFSAALIVVLSHARGFLFQEYGALPAESRTAAMAAFYAITRLGHESVIIFFVLSGYLVGGKAFQRMASHSFMPSDYAVDRIFRIWIPLLPALILTAVLAPDAPDLGTWVGNLLGLQGVVVPSLGGNGPLWSLAYEIWFYVLAYAIGRQAIRKTIDVPALLLIALTTLIFTKLEVQYLACWLIGAAFYAKPHRLSTASSLMLSGIICALAVAGLQLTGAGIASALSGPPVLRAGLEMLLAVGAGIACVTLVTLKPTRICAVVAPMAAFSYTLYLTHFPLLTALRSSGWARIDTIDLRAFVIYALAIISCMLIAWLIYLPFERNTSRLRSWFKSSSTGQRAVAKS